MFGLCTFGRVLPDLWIERATVVRIGLRDIFHSIHVRYLFKKMYILAISQPRKVSTRVYGGTHKRKHGQTWDLEFLKKLETLLTQKFLSN